MAESSDTVVGRLLARTYRVERRLGRGGMGAVYLARNVRTDGLVALKLLHRESADAPDIFRRFRCRQQ